MNREARLHYIFEQPDPWLSTSGVNVSPWDWIEYLRGDIRTMLKGIQCVDSGVRELAPGLPLGGGNAALQVLLTTELEVVSRLYSGNGAAQDVWKNVSEFITHFFVGAPIAIFPQLFWNAVRNQIHHSFYPATWTHRKRYIRFVYLRDRQKACAVTRGPDPKSGAEIVCVHLFIPHVVHTLDKAIGDYKEQLKKDRRLQMNFISVWKAWARVEPLRSRAKSRKRVPPKIRRAAQKPCAEELEKLLRIIDQNSSVELFAPTALPSNSVVSQFLGQ